MLPQPTDSGGADAKPPLLSVVITVYNRARWVGRTLESCLSQNLDESEIIIVDDGSEDDSVKVIEQCTRKHPKVRLVLSPRNQGVTVARGLGASHARGTWVTFLDSDDTFHPGAVELICNEVRSIPQEVGDVRFCYYNEELQSVTPVPLMPEGLIGFPEYLAWLDKAASPDTVYCHRRAVYEEVPWPTDRRGTGHLLLQLASRFKLKMIPHVVITAHNDAPGRITDAMRTKTALDPKWQQRAHDDAVGWTESMAQFGNQMKRYSPQLYEWLDYMIATRFFRAGYRAKGCLHMLRQLARHPLFSRGWVLLILGLLGPRAMHLGRTLRRKVAPSLVADSLFVPVRRAGTSAQAGRDSGGELGN